MFQYSNVTDTVWKHFMQLERLQHINTEEELSREYIKYIMQHKDELHHPFLVDVMVNQVPLMGSIIQSHQEFFITLSSIIQQTDMNVEGVSFIVETRIQLLFSLLQKL